MTKLILPTAALILVGTISAAFLLALLGNFEPEQHGFFHRWLSFAWRYCMPAGIVAAGVFLFVYRRQIMRP